MEQQQVTRDINQISHQNQLSSGNRPSANQKADIANQYTFMHNPNQPLHYGTDTNYSIISRNQNMLY